MTVPRSKGRLWQGAAVVLAAGLTVALTQATTSAAFTAQTGDGGNQVTASSSFCVSPSGTTLGVTNDTYVSESSPTTVNGGPALSVSSGTGVQHHSLLRFTLPTLQPHCEITSATLRLHATSSQGPGTIDVHRASATWTSAAATWNMAARPGPAGTAVGFTAGTTGWHQWTVTTLVQELYAGPDYGFLIKDAVNNASPSRATLYESLDSGNVVNRPQLVLTWG